MTQQQRKRDEQREQLRQRRAELRQEISRGEASLLTTDDDRTRQSLDARLTAMRNEFAHVTEELRRDWGEPFEEFKARMDCEYIRIERDDQLKADEGGGRQANVGAGCYLFRNGAWSDGRMVHSEPPEEPLHRLPREVEFLRRALAREEKLFHQCRKYISEQAQLHRMSSGPLPDEEAFNDLDNFRDNVKRLREELADVRGQLDQLRGPTSAETYAKVTRARHRAADEAARRARATSLD